MTRPRRSFTKEFKLQIVELYQSGKRKCDILEQYDLSSSVLDNWIKKYEATGSFREKDNLTAEQKELIELRKQN
ncbi:transposase [Fusobacterium sp. PH5-44]